MSPARAKTPENVRTLGRLYHQPSVTVELEEWRYVDVDGTETQYVERAAGRHAYLVVGELAAALGDDVDEYITPGYAFKYDGQIAGRDLPRIEQVPRYDRIACYAVVGGSEGHYVHVDLHLHRDVSERRGDPREEGTLNLVLIKTFKGAEHAWLLARRCAELLGAV